MNYKLLPTTHIGEDGKFYLSMSHMSSAYQHFFMVNSTLVIQKHMYLESTDRFFEFDLFNGDINGILATGEKMIMKLDSVSWEVTAAFQPDDLLSSYSVSTLQVIDGKIYWVASHEYKSQPTLSFFKFDSQLETIEVEYHVVVLGHKFKSLIAGYKLFLITKEGFTEDRIVRSLPLAYDEEKFKSAGFAALKSPRID